MKIYTRTGDTGETGLFGGARVRKDHERVRAYGAIDEANSAIGVASAACPPELAALLVPVMSDLLDVGSELASPAPSPTAKVPRIGADRVAALEAAIDDATARLPPLSTFILPSGCDAAARLHLARTVVRRAEREVVTLSSSIEVRPEVLTYLNRLSDALFVWARLANQLSGTPDVGWQATRR